MPSPDKIMSNDSFIDDGINRFDRSRFVAKLSKFDKDVLRSCDSGNSGDCIIEGIPCTDDDSLSYDDSIADSTTNFDRKDSLHFHYAGALEQALMRSPVQRARKPAGYLKTPKSARGRGLGLARFTRMHSPASEHDKVEGSSMPGLEPIWQCSELMSVGASVAAKTYSLTATGEGNNHQTVAAKSAHMYHPDSPRTGSLCAEKIYRNLRDGRMGSDGKKKKQQSSVLSSFPPSPTDKPRRSKSLDPCGRSSPRQGELSSQKSPGKSIRRKLKVDAANRLSQSEHYDLEGKSSATLLMSPSNRNTKSRRKVRSKASSLRDVTAPFSGINSGKDKGRESSTEHKKKKNSSKKSKERSKSIARPVLTNMDEVLLRSLDGRDRSDRKKLKKKRSKSLSRVNLYEHESVDHSKRDPSKRRGKRELHGTSGDVRSNSPKPYRHGSGASASGGKRLSRRQMLNKMDSESVLSSATATASPLGRRRGRSASPRQGRSSTTSSLLQRRDSRRNPLDGSVHETAQYQNGSPDGATLRDSLGKLPRRGDLQRSLNNSPSAATSANTSRRRLSAKARADRNAEDRRELMKRIESVNRYFGKGKGEIGSAYPS